MGRGQNKSKKRGEDTHHFFFPKKLYGKDNRLLTLPYEIHHEFHNFFMAHCKFPPRVCRKCQFEFICCYCNTQVPFGGRVK